MSESKELQFEYTATDDAGEVVTGMIAAESVLEAAQQLKQRGLSVESIQQHTPQDVGRGDVDAAGQPLPLESHFADIFRQRESLIAALTAVHGELPAGQTRREIGQLISDLRRASSGVDLSRTKSVVDWMPLLVATSSAGSQRWGDLITRTKSEIDRRNNRRRTFVYPFAIAAIAIAVFLLLSLLLLPAFAEMFAEFGLKLPPLTLWIFAASDFVNEYPILLAALLIAAFVLVYGVVRLWTHYAMTTRLFGFAVSGDIRSVLAMSSLTGRLAELTDAKLTLPDALWIAGQGCRHYHFRRVAEQLSADIRDCEVPVRDCPGACYLPKNVIDALDAAPAPNVTLLRELSAMYGARAARRIDWANGAFVPTAIIVIGAMVGTIVIALFMPMVSLIQGLTS